MRKTTFVHNTITMIESSELEAGTEGEAPLCEKVSVAYYPKIVAELFPRPTTRQQELIKFLIQSADRNVSVSFSARAMCYLLEGLQGVETTIPDEHRLAVQDLAIYYEVPTHLIFGLRSVA